MRIYSCTYVRTYVRIWDHWTSKSWCCVKYVCGSCVLNDVRVWSFHCMAGDAQLHEGQLAQQGGSGPQGTKHLPPGVSWCDFLVQCLHPFGQHGGSIRVVNEYNYIWCWNDLGNYTSQWLIWENLQTFRPDLGPSLMGMTHTNWNGRLFMHQQRKLTSGDPLKSVIG